MGRFGGGSRPSIATPDSVMELLRGMSEENQATFMRELDDVSSLEGDKPQVGVHGAEITLCSLLRELYCIGVAVLLDARTILLPRGHGFCPFWLCWTVRGHFRRFCAIL